MGFSIGALSSIGFSIGSFFKVSSTGLEAEEFFPSASFASVSDIFENASKWSDK